MKALFVHDHNFVYNPKTNLYYDGSGGAFDSRLWQRYLEIFDELTVVGRKIDTLPNRLVVSSAENVKFNLITGVHGVKAVLKNKKRVVKELESVIKQVDLVIIRLPSTLGSWAVNVCKKLNKTYVLEVVGDPFEAYWYHGNILGRVVAPIAAYDMKKLVKESQYTIYVTKNQLQQKYPCANKVESISNVRLLKTSEVEKVEDFYEKKRNKFIIGMIGSFHVRYKGHIEALSALKKLKNKGFEDIELEFVGSGDPTWVLDLAREYRILDSIKIIGTLPAGEEGIFPFLDNLDLYIHPSLTEGLPRVVIEAMSRGRICLASDAGGTVELLNRGDIHKAGDWKKLADDIEKIYNFDSMSKQESAIRNLKEAERYKEDQLQAKRVAFFKEVIANNILKGQI